MLKAVQLCLQLRPDGLATAGVPCHSFVWVNSGTAQRTHDSPFGREDLDYIAAANTIATRTCLLWMLCTVRFVYFFHRTALEFKVVQPPLCGARDVNALQDYIRVEEFLVTCLKLGSRIWVHQLKFGIGHMS